MSVPKVKPRLKVENVKSYDILGYDIDNLYPQRILDIVAASGRATACIGMYASFIEGDGFTNVNFSGQVINSDDQTTDDLLSEMAYSLAQNDGYYLHVNFNLLGQPVEVRVVPFEFCRFEVVDKELTGRIAVYDNWDRSKGRIDKEKIKRYQSYDLEKAAQGIEEHGVDYAGQIYYWSSAGKESYPKATIDPELESAISDGLIPVYHYKNLSNSYMGSVVITNRMQVEDNDDDVIGETFLAAQGADNAGSIIYLSGVEKDDIGITPIEGANSDKQYTSTEQSLNDRIRKLYGLPPVLVGDLVSGKLGTSNEFVEAQDYYNIITGNARRRVERDITAIFKDWGFPINETGDYSIQEFSGFEIEDFNPELLTDLTQNERRELAGFAPIANQQARESVLVETIGVGGVQGILELLQSPLATEQKVSTLEIVFGVSNEDAVKMVGNVTN